MQRQYQNVKPYYNYNGYASKGTPSFVLDPAFINALKYDNFKINGVKIPYTTGKKRFLMQLKMFKNTTKHLQLLTLMEQ